MTSSIFDTLVSKTVRQACTPNTRTSLPSSSTQTRSIPTSIKSTGAIAIIDLSGYTGLTELLFESSVGDGSNSSGNGGERVYNVVNPFLEGIINCCEEYHGDVIKFCGDALIVSWSVFNNNVADGDTSTQERNALARAFTCSLAVLQRFGSYIVNLDHDSVSTNRQDSTMSIESYKPVITRPGRAGRSSFSIGIAKASDYFRGSVSNAGGFGGGGGAGGISKLNNMILGVHVGIGFGDIYHHFVGVKENKLETGTSRCDYFILGDAVESAGEMLEKTHRGEICMRTDQWNILVNSIPYLDSVSTNTSIKTSSKYYTLLTLGSMIDVKIGSLIGWVKRIEEPPKCAITVNENSKDFVMESAVARFKELATSTDLTTPDIRQLQLRFSELRKIIVVFLKLGSPSLHSNSIQEQSRQFVYDDKGFTALISQTVEMLLSLPTVRFSIGVSEGKSYTGIIGSELRQDYNLFGRCVNLAARCMSSPQAQQSILCDGISSTTPGYETFQFGTAIPTQLKGVKEIRELRILQSENLKSRQVTVKRTHKENEEHKSDSSRWGNGEKLMGRENEIEQLTESFDSWFQFNKESLVIIKGDAGVGKTTLASLVAEKVLREVSNRTVVFIEGQGTEMTRQHAFHVLRSHLLPNFLSSLHKHVESLQSLYLPKFDIQLSGVEVTSPDRGTPTGTTSARSSFSVHTSSEYVSSRDFSHGPNITGNHGEEVNRNSVFIKEVFHAMNIHEKLLPVFNLFIEGCDFVETDELRAISVLKKRAIMRQLLYYIVKVIHNKLNIKMAIMIDNYQWTDSKSQAFINQLRVTFPQILLIIITRSSSEYSPGERSLLPSLCEDVRATVISLEGLSFNDSKRLIEKLWNGSVDVKLAEQDKIHLDSTKRNLLLLDDTPASIVTPQYDALTPSFREVIGISSVMGTMFSLDDIEYVRKMMNPYHEENTEILNEVINKEDTFKFLISNLEMGELKFSFKSEFIQQMFDEAICTYEELMKYEEVNPVSGKVTDLEKAKYAVFVADFYDFAGKAKECEQCFQEAMFIITGQKLPETNLRKLGYILRNMLKIKEYLKELDTIEFTSLPLADDFFARLEDPLDILIESFYSRSVNCLMKFDILGLSLKSLPFEKPLNIYAVNITNVLAFAEIFGAGLDLITKMRDARKQIGAKIQARGEGLTPCLSSLSFLSFQVQGARSFLELDEVERYIRGKFTPLLREIDLFISGLIPMQNRQLVFSEAMAYKSDMMEFNEAKKYYQLKIKAGNDAIKWFPDILVRDAMEYELIMRVANVVGGYSDDQRQVEEHVDALVDMVKRYRAIDQKVPYGVSARSVIQFRIISMWVLFALGSDLLMRVGERNDSVTASSRKKRDQWGLSQCRKMLLALLSSGMKWASLAVCETNKTITTLLDGLRFILKGKFGKATTLWEGTTPFLQATVGLEYISLIVWARLTMLRVLTTAISIQRNVKILGSVKVHVEQSTVFVEYKHDLELFRGRLETYETGKAMDSVTTRSIMDRKIPMDSQNNPPLKKEYHDITIMNNSSNNNMKSISSSVPSRATNTTSSSTKCLIGRHSWTSIQASTLFPNPSHSTSTSPKHLPNHIGRTTFPPSSAPRQATLVSISPSVTSSEWIPLKLSVFLATRNILWDGQRWTPLEGFVSCSIEDKFGNLLQDDGDEENSVNRMVTSNEVLNVCDMYGAIMERTLHISTQKLSNPSTSTSQQQQQSSSSKPSSPPQLRTPFTMSFKPVALPPTFQFPSSTPSSSFTNSPATVSETNPHPKDGGLDNGVHWSLTAFLAPKQGGLIIRKLASVTVPLIVGYLHAEIADEEGVVVDSPSAKDATSAVSDSESDAGGSVGTGSGGSSHRDSISMAESSRVLLDRSKSISGPPSTGTLTRTFRWGIFNNNTINATTSTAGRAKTSSTLFRSFSTSLDIPRSESLLTSSKKRQPTISVSVKKQYHHQHGENIGSTETLVPEVKILNSRVTGLLVDVKFVESEMGGGEGTRWAPNGGLSLVAKQRIRLHRQGKPTIVLREVVVAEVGRKDCEWEVEEVGEGKKRVWKCLEFVGIGGGGLEEHGKGGSFGKRAWWSVGFKGGRDRGGNAVDEQHHMRFAPLAPSTSRGVNYDSSPVAVEVSYELVARVVLSEEVPPSTQTNMTSTTQIDTATLNLVGGSQATLGFGAKKKKIKTKTVEVGVPFHWNSVVEDVIEPEFNADLARIEDFEYDLGSVSVSVTGSRSELQQSEAGSSQQSLLPTAPPTMMVTTPSVHADTLLTIVERQCRFVRMSFLDTFSGDSVVGGASYGSGCGGGFGFNAAKLIPWPRNREPFNHLALEVELLGGCLGFVEEVNGGVGVLRRRNSGKEVLEEVVDCVVGFLRGVEEVVCFWVRSRGGGGNGEDGRWKRVVESYNEACESLREVLMDIVDSEVDGGDGEDGEDVDGFRKDSGFVVG
ncbi:hypothetical protein HDU76_003906 [Blyttiomyces sp. JEL0837]|nr:hypothetical protein HDU76_003906 [Blyttiomyces sp. JEL0837]